MNSFPMARVAPEKADFRPALPLGFLPGVSGTHMTKMTYGEQLKHPNWQRKRLERLSAADWTCQGCKSKEVTLHVHHKRYIKGHMAWDYEDSDFDVLCEQCHSEAHDAQDEFLALLGSVDIKSRQRALPVLAGWLVGDCCTTAPDPYMHQHPRLTACGLLALDAYLSGLTTQEILDIGSGLGKKDANA